jgi:hypothetical protein
MVVCWRARNRTLIARNINSMCNDLYGIIVVLCHDTPGIITCTCAYVTCVAAIDLCKYVTGTTVTPIEVTAHSIHFPLLCLIHVFIWFCLCSAGSINSGRGGEMCHTVFLPHNQIPYILHIYFIVTVNVGGLIGIRRNS